MKTILQRNDNSSIYCSVASSKYHASSLKTKATQLVIASFFIVVGLYIILSSL